MGDWYRIEKLGDGVYAFIDQDGGWFRSNSGIIYNGEITILVDTQYNEARTRTLLEEIRNLGLPEPRLLINTHHHGDHAFGNHLVPAPAIMHREAARLVDALAPLVPDLYKQFFPQLDFTGSKYTPPELIAGDRGFEIRGPKGTIRVTYEGPAHTLGDMVVWVDWARVAFVGDLVFNKVTPLAIDGSVRAWQEKLSKLRPRLEGWTIVGGHGPIANDRVLDLLEKYFRHVLGATKYLLDRGLRDPLEIALQASPGPLMGWRGSERLVLNVARALMDLEGKPPGEPVPDLPVLAMKMVEYRERAPKGGVTPPPDVAPPS